jgi:hypothetical protein
MVYHIIFVKSSQIPVNYFQLSTTYWYSPIESHKMLKAKQREFLKKLFKLPTQSVFVNYHVNEMLINKKTNIV